MPFDFIFGDDVALCFSHFVLFRVDIRTFEVLLRTYEVKEGRTESNEVDGGGSVALPPCKRRLRSKESDDMDNESSTTVMVRPCSEARGHTGYLTFARLGCLS